jgi:SAM-dependent methyltransferase
MGPVAMLKHRVKYIARQMKLAVEGKVHRGFCPICERTVFFVEEGWYLRNSYVCNVCRSIPRFRAIIKVLNKHFPNWREMSIHESSPDGPASEKIARECKHYIASQFFHDVPRGQVKDGQRSEDLEHLTFVDGTFDLTITQDVFEHVLRPEAAFAEIARTLKPSGAHVFTLPYWAPRPTLIRARPDSSGGIELLMEPDYHGNPLDPNGSLVVREWGTDLCDFIFRSSGITTTVINIFDSLLGIEGDFLDVFISRRSDCRPFSSFPTPLICSAVS